MLAYPVPDACADSPYTVSVNGRSVPVEKAGVFRGAFYARFQFSGEVDVDVGISPEAADLGQSGEAVLKPARFRTGFLSETDEDGTRISFKVRDPGPRFISLGDGAKPWPLIVFAEARDARTSAPEGDRVVNVRDFISAGGRQTRGIQQALDEASRRKGTVIFPAGRYVAGTLRIRDDTTVYLAPGALLEASEDPADFPVDTGQAEKSAHGPEESFSRFICFDHCRNAKIVGHGVIEGRGDVLRNKHGRHIHAMDVIGSSNISIEGIVLRNSAAWTLHILGSRQVTVRNAKIVADWAVGNTDGIDPDCSQDIVITGFYGYCGDDAVAIKATRKLGFPGPSQNITVRDSIVMTRKTSFKIGTETYADICNVTFEGCDAVNSSRGIGLWMRDGGTMQNITFRDLRLDLSEIPGEGWSGEPFRATVEERNGLGRIRNVLFERIQVSTPYRSFLIGHPRSPIGDLTFQDCSLHIRPREVKKSSGPIFELRDCSGLRLIRLTVQWDINDPALWQGVLTMDNCSHVVVNGLKERGFPVE